MYCSLDFGLVNQKCVASFAALDVNSGQEERDAFDSQQPDVEDGIGDDNHDEVALKMIEDSPSGILRCLLLMCGSFMKILAVKSNFSILSFLL